MRKDVGYLQVLERQWVILEQHALVVSSVVTGLAETIFGFPRVEAACHNATILIADEAGPAES